MDLNPASVHNVNLASQLETSKDLRIHLDSKDLGKIMFTSGIGVNFTTHRPLLDEPSKEYSEKNQAILLGIGVRFFLGGAQYRQAMSYLR